MTCPDCEYHKQRAALWRHEAYRLGGTPLPWDADEAIATAVAAERERIKQANAPEIEKINAYIKAIEDAVAAEREACARAASIALLGADKSLSDRVVNAIRSSGQHE